MDAVILFNAALGAGFSGFIGWLLVRTRSNDLVEPWLLFTLAAVPLFIGGAIARFSPGGWLGSPLTHLLCTVSFIILVALGLREMRRGTATEPATEAPARREVRRREVKPATVAGPLLSVMDEADPATLQHCERVAELAVLIAREMGMSRGQVEEVYASALLHDVGKIGVRSSVLRKQQSLTDEEWREVKDHTWLGRVIVDRNATCRPVGHNVLCHHEKYDGSGYPAGLQGEEIPLPARIVAVADAFDVITFGRHYQQPRDEAEAVEELLAHAGTQFDPGVVLAFLRALRTRRHRGLIRLEAV